MGEGVPEGKGSSFSCGDKSGEGLHFSDPFCIVWDFYQVGVRELGAQPGMEEGSGSYGPHRLPAQDGSSTKQWQ